MYFAIYTIMILARLTDTYIRNILLYCIYFGYCSMYVCHAATLLYDPPTPNNRMLEKLNGK